VEICLEVVEDDFFVIGFEGWIVGDQACYESGWMIGIQRNTGCSSPLN
jgi:hypothetical protein